ncbi:MAG: extracellular solute-binding protein [Tepidisphaeraceae bacterium]
MAIVLALLVFIGVGVWSWRARNTSVTSDGRQLIVFWGSADLGDDIYTVLNDFERANPQYKVVWGSAVAQDMVGDAQRLLSGVAGGVPPDVVWFDRFATGEWASRNALTDLTPFIEAQKPDDPYRIKLDEYYPWSIDEASFAPPGSGQAKRLYAIPTTADIRVLFVNADQLMAAGFAEKGPDGSWQPKVPRTWEDVRAYGKKLSRFDDRGRMTRLGFAPLYGNGGLYSYAFESGGNLLDETRTKATLTSPPVQRALKFIVDVTDDLGGAASVNAFQATFQAGAMDPFIAGLVSMKTDGDWYLQTIADWKPDFRFVTAPLPLPADRFEAGAPPVTWAGGFSMVIPATAKNKEGAFKLIQFISSWQTISRIEQGKREQRESEGRLYLPRSMGNRVYYERLVKEAVLDNPRVPPALRQAYSVLRDMMPKTMIRPVSPVGQLLWNQHLVAYESATNHRFRARVAASKKK